MRTRRTSVLAAAAMVGGAAVGLIGAHVLDYVLVFSDPATRAHVLAQSGHAAMPSLFASAALGAFIASAVMLCAGWARGHDGRGRALTFGPALARLATMQVGGFVILELAERLRAGLPAHHLLSPVLPLGLVLQVLTAALGALILVLLYRAGERLARARKARRPRLATVSEIFPVVHLLRAGRAALEPYAPRGPPLASIA